MPYRLSSLLLAIALLLPAAARAQGFNSYSGRNHPELEWRVAETPHFEIMYPARLAGIETEAAAVAESTYAVLAHNLGVTFDERLRIYLSDEDEITNGFAVPLGTGYTQIWVHPSDLAARWTGREKWLRKVLAHELGHLFHYRAVRSNLGPYEYLFGDPLPRFWTEGLAQYQTEVWDAYRGDRWLRTAVLDDRLSYRDGRSAWNGRLLYAVGNAQVRYFAEQYGDSTLARLLAHRSPVLLGLGRVHDFEAAFRAVAGTSYRDFYDDWRRAVNVYYNTLAGGLETADSLGAEPLGVPGQYLYDVQTSPDTTRLAVLGLASLARPVRRLYVVDRATQDVEIVAEGRIEAPVAWSPDGRRLAYAQQVRGPYGALLYDLFVVDADGGGRQRLTRARRASAPAFAPDGDRLAYVVHVGGTANLVVRDLATGAEQAVTAFTGDVQIGGVAWHPADDLLAFARFDADGRRDLVLLDLATGALRPLTDGTHDDRLPVWSPDGARLAFTSLRDDVPNVFVYDLAADAVRRVTYLVTGATGHDWLPPDPEHPAGTLLVGVNVSKTRDQVFRIDAARTAGHLAPPEVPAAYTAWTTHAPPRVVPTSIPPAPDLVVRRYPYRAWRNLTHVWTVGLPYYAGPRDWGALGWTSWLEPLGKHLVFVGGALSAGDVARSGFLATYVNNQLRPTITLEGYRLPRSARLYGGSVLVETLTGGDVTVRWPLDWRARPYTQTALGVRLRYAELDPVDVDASDVFGTPDDVLPVPVRGRQADVSVALTRRVQRPYRYNAVHPLDGRGVQVRATAAADVLGADARFLRGDAAAYAVLPALGTQRLFVYGRAQAQTGDPLPQDVLGFPRYDAVQLGLPGVVPFALDDAERVRGYRRYALGNRVLFGSAEYRALLLPSLQTRVLGLIDFGATAAALFADGGLVWSGAAFDARVARLGVGAELKNALRLGGVVQVTHAVGVAQPAAALGGGDVEVYYRLRAAVPF